MLVLCQPYCCCGPSRVGYFNSCMTCFYACCSGVLLHIDSRRWVAAAWLLQVDRHPSGVLCTVHLHCLQQGHSLMQELLASSASSSIGSHKQQLAVPSSLVCDQSASLVLLLLQDSASYRAAVEAGWSSEHLQQTAAASKSSSWSVSDRPVSSVPTSTHSWQDCQVSTHVHILGSPLKCFHLSSKLNSASTCMKYAIREAA